MPETATERPESTASLLKRVYREIIEDDVPGQAAKLAYYAFLALPPALMTVFALAGLIGSERLAEWIESRSRLALPAEVNEVIIQPFIEQVVLENAPGPLSIGLLLALFSASTVFAGLMDSLNRAFDLEESRPFLKKRAVALGVMAIGVILFIIAAGALLLGPQIARALGLGSVGLLIWNIVQWPLAFSMIVAAFWLGYYLLPNRDQRGSEGVLLRAAAAGAALWVLGTAAFRLYIANLGSYSESYGFLGAFIVLLLWLYMTSLAVLAGGELASEMVERD